MNLRLVGLKQRDGGVGLLAGYSSPHAVHVRNALPSWRKRRGKELAILPNT